MSVKLYDAPTEIDYKIANLARVSSENPDNPNYKSLIKFLIREGHWSPLDMCNIVIEVNTEKDISIQILRHDKLIPQEWSQRYADCSDMKGPIRELRLQDKDNRQNSIECNDPELLAWWIDAQIQVQKLCFGLYGQAIAPDKNIAKELARSLLPIGLTSTKMFLNASIRSLLFYCKSRMHHSTQKEHRVVANEVYKILLEVAPCTTLAFSEVFNLQLEHFNQ